MDACVTVKRPRLPAHPLLLSLLSIYIYTHAWQVRGGGALPPRPPSLYLPLILLLLSGQQGRSKKGRVGVRRDSLRGPRRVHAFAPQEGTADIMTVMLPMHALGSWTVTPLIRHLSAPRPPPPSPSHLSCHYIYTDAAGGRRRAAHGAGLRARQHGLHLSPGQMISHTHACCTLPLPSTPTHRNQPQTQMPNESLPNPPLSHTSQHKTVPPAARLPPALPQRARAPAPAPPHGPRPR